jgi:parallel beta-helix repeat protein
MDLTGSEENVGLRKCAPGTFQLMEAAILNRILRVLGLLIVAAAAHPPLVPAAVSTAEMVGPDTVHIAPPTGERDVDRASILAALEQVRPGDTVQFAPGTYLVGETISIATPLLTLLGHPDGTTLRGCDASGFDGVGRVMVANWMGEPVSDEMRASVDECGIFGLTGGHATVRGLTFEHSWSGLILGCCEAELQGRPTDGGYLIEDNTFRNIINGVRGILWAPDPTVIRGNRFVNTFHAVAAFGSRLHVLDNHVSVPDPARVSVIGYPGFAMTIGGGTMPNDTAAVPCDGNTITGNRIGGHPDGITILALPGTTCRYNAVRENTIVAATPSFDRARPSGKSFGADDSAPSIITGMPLSLFALADPDGGPTGRVEESVVEGNRVLGAHGLGIELVRASGNRIANNVITDIRRRDSFPGNVVGTVPEWINANGSGIWISPGSDDNEIAGNTFADVATDAIVLEGDRNRVETRSPSDAVRDLGSGNQVAAFSHVSRFVETRGVRLHYLDFGGSGLPLIFVHDWYEDAHTWATMAPAYTNAYRVLAMTRRGYGESDDVGWGYDVATQSEDILGFMDALGIERAVLVGRHPTTQDMTWIAEHHPTRLAGLVYLYHAVWPSPGDARLLRDRTFAEMFMRYGGCWMGEEAYLRGAPRLLYRPHYADDGRRRIDVPAISFTHPQDAGAGAGEFDLLDVTLAGAMSADPGGGFCNAQDIAVPVAWLTALANDPERLDAVRALVPASDERRRYAAAFERAFGSKLRIVRLEGAVNYREHPEPLEPHIRKFLEEVSACERALQLQPGGPCRTRWATSVRDAGRVETIGWPVRDDESVHAVVVPPP